MDLQVPDQPTSDKLTEPQGHVVHTIDAQVVENGNKPHTNGHDEVVQTVQSSNDPDDHDDGSEDEDGDKGVVVNDPSLLPEAKKRKKKKNTKSKGKRGLASNLSTEYKGI